MTRKSRVFPLLLLTVLPSVSWALGLGEINLQSALNEPMQAEIAIFGASGKDLEGLKVTLAPKGDFDRLGLDRPDFLSSLRFDVSLNAARQPVLKVTSGKAITEPFVTFLVEARWARGSLLREYTVLLDPPTFMPQATTPAPAVQAPAAPRESAATSGTVLRQPERAPVTESVQPDSPPYTAPPGSHRVGRGQTLWVLAERYRPADVTVNQMMIALYEANPQAFSGNINRLRAGSILRIPSADELQAVSNAAANAAVQEHMESWRPGSGMQGVTIEPKLRLVPPSEPVSRPAATGDGSTAAGDGGEADTYLREEVERLRRELDTAEDRLQVQSDQMAELQRNLEAAARAEGQQPVDAGPADEVSEPAVGVEETEVAPEPAEEQQAAATKAATQKVISAPREESLLDTLLGWLISPLAFVILGILALIAAVLVFLRLRKKDESPATRPWEDYQDLDDDEPDADDATVIRPAVIAATAAGVSQEMRQGHPGFVVHEQPDYEDTANLQADVFEAAGSGKGLDTTTVERGAVGGRTRTKDFDDTASLEAIKPGADAEIADPMAEADFHMAYGLYDQAAEILQVATQRDPGNSELQMKLAEVYFVWGNQDGFRAIAQEMSQKRDSLGDGAWEKMLIMGKQLLPDDKLFGEVLEARAGTDMDLSLEDSQLHEALDLELFDANQNIDDTEIIDLDFGGALDFAGDTQESPGLDSEGEITQETPFIGFEEDADTVETPVQQVEQTAEIDLDDLGLNVSLDDSFIGRLPDDYGKTEVMNAPDLDDNDATAIARPDNTVELAELAADMERSGEFAGVDFDLGGDLDATGSADDLERPENDTATLSANEIDADLMAATLQMERATASPDSDATAEMYILNADDSIDLDLGTLTHTEDVGDTVEQPAPDLDLDNLDGLEGEDHGAAPTVEMDVSDMTMPEAEALTLSEIGTKLDLARAYMDMGDPDGARSILEEVIAEGDDAQQVDAKRLLDKLP
jgi:pilus assembly protein FimV